MSGEPRQSWKSKIPAWGQGGGEAQRGRSPGHVLTSLLRGGQWAPGEDAVHWALPT